MVKKVKMVKMVTLTIMTTITMKVNVMKLTVMVNASLIGHPNHLLVKVMRKNWKH